MSKQLTVTLHVDPAAASRAGRSSVGEHQLVLADADLASLSEAQRETLALHLGGWRAPWHGESSADPYSDPLTHGADPIAEATLPVLGALLDARRARVDAAVSAWEALNNNSDPSLPVWYWHDDCRDGITLNEGPHVGPVLVTDLPTGHPVGYGVKERIWSRQVRAALSAEIEATTAASVEAREQAEAEREAARQARLAEAAAGEAKIAERYPAELRDRLAAGWAGEAEIAEARAEACAEIRHEAREALMARLASLVPRMFVGDGHLSDGHLSVVQVGKARHVGPHGDLLRRGEPSTEQLRAAQRICKTLGLARDDVRLRVAASGVAVIEIPLRDLPAGVGDGCLRLAL